MNETKSNMKNTIKFLVTIALKNKIRLGILFIYSIVCGYLIPYWPILLKQVINGTDSCLILKAQISLIIITGLHFSFDYAKDLFLFPIHNYASYQLRLTALTHAHDIALSALKPGGIISRLQRSTSGKNLFKAIPNCLKHITMIINSIYLIGKQHFATAITTTIVFLIYLIVIYLIQKIYKKIRRAAWNATEEASTTSSKILDETIAVRQNILTQEQVHSALKSELQAWHSYYLKSNLIFGGISFFGVLLIAQSLSNLTIALLTWQLANSMKVLTNDIRSMFGTIIDIEILLAKKQPSYEQSAKNTSIQNITIKDVKIHNLGPFNFQTKTQSKIIALCGQNGAGKTQLALAISNLIPYKGTIQTPRALYLNAETHMEINAHNSTGQNAIELITHALNTNYKLLILDEVLDVLSQENLAKIIKQLKQSNKTILIITHQKNIMQEADEIITI